jgi:hypothetical protein
MGMGQSGSIRFINDTQDSFALAFGEKQPRIQLARTATQFINGTGDLIIGSGATGITGATALAKVEIQGDLAIVDGTQQAGYVLTSDANGVASWQSGGTGGGGAVVSTQDISGSTSIDLSVADVFILTITADVTNFTFTNEVVGREYTFVFIKNTTNKAFTWATGKFFFGFGNAPVLTDPTTNGTAPATSKDIVTAISTESGKLDVVLTPNLIAN